MLMEFFRFEWRQQLRSPFLWCCALVLGVLGLLATCTDAVSMGESIGNVHRNAPSVIANMLMWFSIVALMVVAGRMR